MKYFKTLSALTASSLMAFTMVTTPVFAADGDGTDTTPTPVTQTIDFSTTVVANQKNNGISLPDGVKFKFEPKYGNEMVDKFLTVNNANLDLLTQLVKEQVNTGANLQEIPVEPAEAQFTVQVNQINGTTENPNPTNPDTETNKTNHYVYAHNMTLTLNQDNIDHPGIYYFRLDEIKHTFGDSQQTETLDGLTGDDNQKVIVAVLLTHPVTKDDSGNITETKDGYEVGQVLWYKLNESQTGVDKIYDSGHTTTYGQNEGYFTAQYTTGSLIIKKEVKGNLGNKNVQFPIQYQIVPSNSGETYVETASTDSNYKVDDTDHNKGTAELKHDGTLTISGLSDGDTVYVFETSTKKNDGTYQTSDGYKVTYNGGTNVSENTNVDYSSYVGGQSVTQIASAPDNTKTETVTNTKDSDNPITGIAHNYGPFALMTAVGVAFAGFFFRRRREE